MLEVKDIAVFRGDRLVFEALSFTLSAGEALVLTGPNGAGKTTLLRVLAGLARPVAGAILWNGAEAIADLAQHGRRIGYLGHQDGLKPSLTVGENLTLGAAAPDAAGLAALEAVGLADLADLPGRFLSAGQRRRLALARLIAQGRPLWLLDEPTTALDAASVAALGGIVAGHRAAGGMVVAATHADLPLPDHRRLSLAA